MEKKRYILFACDTYYPSGGMDDARVSFELEEYEKIKKEWYGKYEWYQVFDVATFKVYDGNRNEMPKING